MPDQNEPLTPEEVYEQLRGLAGQRLGLEPDIRIALRILEATPPIAGNPQPGQSMIDDLDARWGSLKYLDQTRPHHLYADATRDKYYLAHSNAEKGSQGAVLMHLKAARDIANDLGTDEQRRYMGAAVLRFEAVQKRFNDVFDREREPSPGSSPSPQERAASHSYGNPAAAYAGIRPAEPHEPRRERAPQIEYEAELSAALTHAEDIGVPNVDDLKGTPHGMALLRNIWREDMGIPPIPVPPTTPPAPTAPTAPTAPKESRASARLNQQIANALRPILPAAPPASEIPASRHTPRGATQAEHDAIALYWDQQDPRRRYQGPKDKKLYWEYRARVCQDFRGVPEALWYNITYPNHTGGLMHRKSPAVQKAYREALERSERRYGPLDAASQALQPGQTGNQRSAQQSDPRASQYQPARQDRSASPKGTPSPRGRR